MTSSKVDLSFNKIRRLVDLADLAELLFPGNRNQQHAFLVVWISLKWARHHMVPNLSEIAKRYGVSKRTLERVRAKMRRMGLIDHVSRFTQRFGYREAWTLSTRFEKSLRQLAELTMQFKNTSVGSQDKDMLILQLAQGVIMVLNLIAMLITVHLTLRDLEANEAAVTMIRARQCPACSAIPVRLILENPACAGKLLRVMNVTNVRVLPRRSSRSLVERARPDAKDSAGRVEPSEESA
ncbi:MAG: hypothetical protein JXA69_08240 [Phycisphaerae bacterium]|nr:hypothetical protein [Phycisphaerae bacterium]